MFWDDVAGVYDIFVRFINRKTHTALRGVVAALVGAENDVLECACGTGLLSAVIASRCRTLTATDFSEKMLRRAERNCASFDNVTFERADITMLDYPDGSFDKVVAGNVIHLLDEPLKALGELDRVCRRGGTLIIPTYMNRDGKGRTGGFATAVGKAGADFKRQFTAGSYEAFFRDAGYKDVKLILAEGRIPCAVAVMKKKEEETLTSTTPSYGLSLRGGSL